jgi:hypothetical protein
MGAGVVIGFIFALLILFGVIGVVLYQFYDGQPDEEGDANDSESLLLVNGSILNDSIMNGSDENASIVDDFPNAEEIHWSHMPLTYKIVNEDSCAGVSLSKMEEALSKIEESTEEAVAFDKVSHGEVDLVLNCISGREIFESFENDSVTCEEFSFDYVKNYFDPVREGFIEREDYLVNFSKTGSNVSADETVYEVCYIDFGKAASADNFGGLKEGEPVMADGVIVSHEINIFVSGEGWNPCSHFPAREMHELLHGFGFKHAAEPTFDPTYGWPPQDLNMLGDVMFADRFCNYQRTLDEKYPSCLKRIYSGEGNCEGVRF